MQELKLQGTDACPFSFNFDPQTFKPGDYVSYRVVNMADFPFVGQLLEVHVDHVVISPNDTADPGRRMRGTRDSRPLVDANEALG